MDVVIAAGSKPLEPKKVFRFNDDMRELLRQMLENIDRIVEVNKLMLSVMGAVAGSVHVQELTMRAGIGIRNSRALRAMSL